MTLTRAVLLALGIALGSWTVGALFGWAVFAWTERRGAERSKR